MGELINLNPKQPITDADIPSVIARDTETVAAIADHEAKTDPHPNLWTRITNTFLSLAGGQRIEKVNPAISAISYDASQNHLELRTPTQSGTNPILGFHRAGFSATALYHAGYGDNSLRIQNADGLNAAIIHDGNIAQKTAGNANNLINLLGSLIGPANHWNATYRWRHLGDWGAGDNAILVHRAFVADRAAAADSVGGVISAVMNATLPAQASTTGSVGLGSIDPAKIVGLSAIATCSIAGSIFYVPPYGGLGSSSGFEYGLYASKVSGSNYLNLWTATAARSQSILGAPVKILVSHIQ